MVLSKRLKLWFIPHKNNQHRPHIVRVRGFVSVMVLVLAVQLVFNLGSAHQFKVLGYATSINQADLLDQTNQQRAQNGVAALTENAKLDQAALAKAQDMFKYDYWAHVNPTTGEQPWTFVTDTGYSYQAAGENLAMNFDTSAGVIAGWMGSSEHRANLLNASYQDIGMAALNGTLQGEETTLVVAFYAEPYAKVPATPKAQVPHVQAPLAPPATTTSQQSAASPAAITPVALTPAPTPTPAGLTFNLPHTGRQYSIIKPLAISRSLPLAKLVTIGMLGTVAVVDVMEHTLIWRIHKKLKRRKNIWFKYHPLVQAGLLMAIIIFTVTTSLGAIK